MTEEVTHKKGEYILTMSGEYDDYNTHTLYKIKLDFNIFNLIQNYKNAESKKPLSVFYFYNYLVSHGFIESVEYEQTNLIDDFDEFEKKLQNVYNAKIKLKEDELKEYQRLHAIYGKK